MTLSGWQSIAALLIAAGLAVAGVVAPNGSPLVALAASMVTGVFALLQPRRDPNSRGRAADRIPTAAGGVPTYDPHKTPREGTQPVYPGPDRRRPK